MFAVPYHRLKNIGIPYIKTLADATLKDFGGEIIGGLVALHSKSTSSW